ncbi:MAG TPA: His/Gly/Thr/Pro-type tRNA ligase C-terminal domain-containing protein, partial [Candidatus Nanoarchaeia archaeon]
DAKLIKIAKDIYKDLKKEWNVMYDEVGTVGRRYRRQDEIGTPYAITVDFDTLKDNSVTVRDRDSMEQERVKVSEIPNLLNGKLL